MKIFLIQSTTDLQCFLKPTDRMKKQSIQEITQSLKMMRQVMKLLTIIVMIFSFPTADQLPAQ